MSGKISTSHLDRRAIVYVRQSTTAQVIHNGESTARQYALADRARALGWPEQSVEVIDEDLGRSGASTEGRTGVARLAASLARGDVGGLFALEVSRVARSSQDWHQILRLCVVADVVVIDECSVYDPGNKDDKLLLDLKGTMSEAELTWLSLRMAGARRNKARRGEFRVPTATGYIWDSDGLMLDPDESVQQAIRSVFARFEVEPTAWAVVRWAHETGLTFPIRGPRGDLSWKPLGYSRLYNVLRNPVYAGAYTYGRQTSRERLVDGEIRRVRAGGRDPKDWLVCIKDAHPGYISWEAYVKNGQKLKENGTRLRLATQGAAREGDALLTGLLVCGRCGQRMHPLYGSENRAAKRWYYQCSGERLRGAPRSCWIVAGKSLDAEVEDVFLARMVPGELELCLAVEHEVAQQASALAAQWKLRIEKTEYEARVAERRYLAVDPDNRVVARTLERQWELKLREVEELHGQYDAARRERRVDLTDEDRAQIRGLAQDLPAVWRSSTTTMADRKAMLRLVIDAVELTPIDVPRQTRVRVQWKSGAVSERFVHRLARGELKRTPASTVERIAELAAAGLRDEAIVVELDREGVRSGTGRTWTISAVKNVRKTHGIKQSAPHLPRHRPLPDRHCDGRFTVAGAARRFAVSDTVVRGWISRGLITASRGDIAGLRGVWWLTIPDEVGERLARDRGPHPPDKAHLPDRHPDGRYSLPGLMRRFGVTKDTVYGWFKKGLLTGTREPWGPYKVAWWVELDDAALARIASVLSSAAPLGADRSERARSGR
jgi:DNA invertase Pin-like site-specific DNA recombinase